MTSFDRKPPSTAWVPMAAPEGGLALTHGSQFIAVAAPASTGPFLWSVPRPWGYYGHVSGIATTMAAAQAGAEFFSLGRVIGAPLYDASRVTLP